MVLLPQTEIADGIFEVTIDPHLIDITKLEIIISLGYSSGDIDHHFNDCISKLLLDLPEKCAPRAGYRIVQVDNQVISHHDTLHHGEPSHTEGFHANGVFFDVHKIVASQLKGSEKIAVFVCTIGNDMEDLSKRLFSEGDPVGGHFADTIASAAVEKVAALLHTHIEAVMLHQGLKITNRYSPGYCGWPVSQQQMLFSFLPDRFCGISLNESSLMAPIKSVSGITGIGRMVTNAPYLCGNCRRNDCTYRTYAAELKKRALVI